MLASHREPREQGTPGAPHWHNRYEVPAKAHSSIRPLWGSVTDSRGGRPLGSGHQLPPQLTVGRRPLGHEATDTGFAYAPVSQAHGHHHTVQCFALLHCSADQFCSVAPWGGGGAGVVGAPGPAESPPPWTDFRRRTSAVRTNEFVAVLRSKSDDANGGRLGGGRVRRLTAQWQSGNRQRLSGRASTAPTTIIHLPLWCSRAPGLTMSTPPGMRWSTSAPEPRAVRQLPKEHLVGHSRPKRVSVGHTLRPETEQYVQWESMGQSAPSCVTWQDTGPLDV